MLEGLLSKLLKPLVVTWQTILLPRGPWDPPEEFPTPLVRKSTIAGCNFLRRFVISAPTSRTFVVAAELLEKGRRFPERKGKSAIRAFGGTCKQEGALCVDHARLYENVKDQQCILHLVCILFPIEERMFSTRRVCEKKRMERTRPQ